MGIEQLESARHYPMVSKAPTALSGVPQVAEVAKQLVKRPALRDLGHLEIWQFTRPSRRGSNIPRCPDGVRFGCRCRMEEFEQISKV